MTNPTQSAIDQNFAGIRRVIETRAYDGLDSLLAEQRTLISNLPFADPETRSYFTQAQSLTAWSLNMVKLQRSALEQTLSDVAKLKQLEEYKQTNTTPQAL